MIADPLSVLSLWLPVIVLALVNVYGIWLLRKHSAFARFVPAKDLESVVPAHDPRGLEVLAEEYHNPDYLKLLEQVINSVSK